ncbi:unnamed protein product [Plutella xylostella]|uniref:(diamondback moth) hypothetical protein n=1 Tax=Plutella xylostella TaxID=51655 RepID=A0A8S4GFN5_PLUXY|nr:unnamed protein product [Plutella xylostella]
MICLPIRVYADAAAGVRYTERFYKLVAFDIFTDEYGSTTSRSGSPISGDERIYLSEVENSDPQYTTLRSVIQAAPTTAPDNRHPPGDDGNVASTSAEPQPGPSGLSSNSNRPALSGDILEALGDPKAKGEVFGPKILDEISERWGRVLVDGLTKEQNVDIQEKNLVPENFKLAKAPLLNQEVIGVLGESVKNRDKLLEKSQNHLGLGIASLASFTSSLIENDLGKIDIIKKISDITQIFLDLHNENIKTRRKETGAARPDNTINGYPNRVGRGGNSTSLPAVPQSTSPVRAAERARALPEPERPAAAAAAAAGQAAAQTPLEGFSIYTMFTTQCKKCQESVGSGASCSSCGSTFHFSCGGITERGFSRLGRNKANWSCVACREAINTTQDSCLGESSSALPPADGTTEVVPVDDFTPRKTVPLAPGTPSSFCGKIEKGKISHEALLHQVLEKLTGMENQLASFHGINDEIKGLKNHFVKLESTLNENMECLSQKITSLVLFG